MNLKTKYIITWKTSYWHHNFIYVRVKIFAGMQIFRIENKKMEQNAVRWWKLKH